MTASMRGYTDHQQPQDLLSAALSHAERGWRIFPLRPNDKRPAVSGWQQRATTDPERIKRCWGSGTYNIGLAAGPSVLVVVDLDQPKPNAVAPEEWQLPGVHWGMDVLAVVAEQQGAELPIETYRVLTPSGGEHLYFARPDGVELHNTAGKLGWLIDTRATGGYVVAAGSVIDGNRYEADETAGVAVLPIWLSTVLTETPSAPARGARPAVDAVARRSRYAAAALRGELDRVLDAQVGQRNDTLNASAFAIGQLVAADLIPETLAIDALAEAAHAAGLGDVEAQATIRSGLAAGAHYPRDEDRHSA